MSKLATFLLCAILSPIVAVIGVIVPIAILHIVGSMFLYLMGYR